MPNVFGIKTRKERRAEIIRSKARKVRGGVTDERWLLESAGQARWNMPDPVVHGNQAALYRLVPEVVTALDLVGKLGAPLKYNVLQAGEEEKDIPNHPFEQLLNHPNPMDSRYEFLFATLVGKLIAGNAYWWLNKSSENAPPDELWTIPPDMIKPIPDEKLYLKGYVYSPGDGTEIPLETWEVIHFKRFNPFNRFTGLSIFESIAVSAVSSNDAREWNAQQFQAASALLSGILAFADPISNPDWEKLKRTVTRAAQERKQLMLRSVGKGGVQWLKAGGTQREMEYLEGLAFSKETMWNAIGPGLSSMLAINANVANSAVGERIFRDLTVWPELELLSDKIEKNILPSYGDGLVGQFDDIRVADRVLEMKEQDVYAVSHTVDEIRKKYYQDKPIGDERGDLLPAEIKTANAFGQAPPALDEEEDIEEAPVKSEYFEELGRYRRKALKRKGKTMNFKSDIIPEGELGTIAAKLADCKSDNEINLLFDSYVKQDGGSNEVQALMQGLRATADIMIARQAPAPIINVTTALQDALEKPSDEK